MGLFNKIGKSVLENKYEKDKLRQYRKLQRSTQEEVAKKNAYANKRLLIAKQEKQRAINKNKPRSFKMENLRKGLRKLNQNMMKSSSPVKKQISSSDRRITKKVVYTYGKPKTSKPKGQTRADKQKKSLEAFNRMFG